MTLELLTARLTEAIADITAIEIAEALWLARQVGPVVSARPSETGDDLLQDQSPKPGTDADPEPRAASPPERRDQLQPSRGQQPPTPRARVNLPASSVPSVEVSGFRLQLPEASALPARQEIQRALRPLRRRVPAAHRPLLDEEMTARLTAETGIRLPVLATASQRWLDLALVIDAAPSMEIWAALVNDLHASLRNLGAFRDIRRWQLWPNGEGLSPYSAFSQAGTGTPRRPGELLDPAGRRLFLVVTDGSAKMWYDKTGARLLATWAANGPVAVLQPLPERLWSRTGLRTVRGEFRSTAPGTPTSRLTFTEHRRRPRLRGPDEIAVPVMEIAPAWFGSWAGLLTTGVAGSVPLPAAIATLGTRRHRLHSTGSGRDAAAVVAEPAVDRFRAAASPDAYRLATLLAAVPLELPVMRLVQATMMPDSGPAHLAEVVLSGLLAVNGDGPGFDFLSGVRPLLLDALTVSDINRVVDTVSGYIARHAGLAGRTFPAIVSLPDGRRQRIVDRSFAWIPPELLARLGLLRPLDDSDTATGSAEPQTMTTRGALGSDPAAEQIRDRLLNQVVAVSPEALVPVASMFFDWLRSLAAQHQMETGGRTLIPDVYRIDLAKHDYDRLRGHSEELAFLLAGAMTDLVETHGWATAQPIIVRLEQGLPGQEAVGVIAAAVSSRIPQCWLETRHGQRIPVPVGSWVIGRHGDQSLTFRDRKLSRAHARLDYDGSKLMITDLGSTNGTLINDQPVTRTALMNDDIVKVGGTVLRVIIIKPESNAYLEGPGG